MNDAGLDVAAPAAPQRAWDALVPTMTERVLMQHIIDAARALGWQCYHPFDSRRSTAGWPDIACVRRDRLVFMELKREGRDLTEAQREWCDALERAGCEVYRPVRPSDFDLMLEILR